MAQITPIGERVLIKPLEEERTAGGIYVPDSVKEGRKEGEVVAVGQMKDNKEVPLKKGDRVIYGGYSNDEVDVDGKKYVIIDLKDVLARVD